MNDTFHNCDECSTGEVTDVYLPVCTVLAVDVKFTCFVCEKTWEKCYTKNYPGGVPEFSTWPMEAKNIVEHPDLILSERGKVLYDANAPKIGKG